MQEGSTNIIQLLEKAATTDAGISIYPPGTAPTKCNRTTYAEFFQNACRHARLIREIPGISKDTVLLLHFDNHVDNFSWFWAVTLAGYTPAISTPLVNDLDQRKKHLLHLYELLEDPMVLTTESLSTEFLGLEQLRLRSIEDLTKSFEGIDGVAGSINPLARHRSITADDLGKEPLPQDVAILMLTSGSTGNAKAVCLRHDQIIKSVEGKCRHLGLSSMDTFLN